MAILLRPAHTVWVVRFRIRGRARRWLKPLPAGADARAAVLALLQDLYDGRATLTALRPATPQEDADYVAGNLPANVLCPTGR